MGAKRPFMFRVAILMFALILGLVWCGFGVCGLPLGVGGRC